MVPGRVVRSNREAVTLEISQLPDPNNDNDVLKYLLVLIFLWSLVQVIISTARVLINIYEGQLSSASPNKWKKCSNVADWCP